MNQATRDAIDLATTFPAAVGTLLILLGVMIYIKREFVPFAFIVLGLGLLAGSFKIWAAFKRLP